MTRYIIFFLFALTFFSSQAYSVKEIPNVHLENKNRYVSNPDGILSAAAQAQADSILSDLWKRTSAEVVVVAVNDIDMDDIDIFATELFSNWGIGKADKDNGLLVLIVKNMRRAALRTGYGMEGVIPDVVAGRIIRNTMAPNFKREDYDAGVIASLQTISSIITTPEATEELLSKYENDANAHENKDAFKTYLMICVILSVFLLIWLISTLISNKGKDQFDKYKALEKLKLPMLMCSIFGMGMPLVAFFSMLLIMRRLRTKKRRCLNCNAKMHRLSEEEDNKYLTPAQDLEEKIDSVDYDVWLCNECGQTEVLPFVKATAYSVCPACGAKACLLSRDRVIVQPAVGREGKGVKEYKCRNCRNVSQVAYILPALPPVIIMGGGGGRGFGGGGGFSGGSFGGGMTGGGGASGGW